MANAVNFDTGPFLEVLRRADRALQQQAQSRIEQAASRMAAQVVSAYHLGPPRKRIESGSLRAGVTWGAGTRRVDARGRAGGVMYGTSGVLGAWVWSRAPHAWLYDHGTVRRENYSKKSANRGAMWGNDPPHTFIKTAIETRQGLYYELASLLDTWMGAV